MHAVTSDQMRRICEASLQSGLSQDQVIENAGRNIAQFALNFLRGKFLLPLYVT